MRKEQLIASIIESADEYAETITVNEKEKNILFNSILQEAIDHAKSGEDQL